MNRSAFIALGFAGALALVASPAAAQHRRNGGGGEGHDNAAPRAESRGDSGSAPRAQAREARPSQERAAPRQEQRSGSREGFRATPRTYAPRYSGSRSYGGRYYGSRYTGPRFSIAPRRFYRPYYVFRPRLSIGFGLYAGYPVSYYDPYYYPYAYEPYATAPGYPPQGSLGVQPSQQSQPNQSNLGGLSFEISPDTAEVYVDGNYAGTVGQFTSNSQPLGLTAGRHHVELREPGYDVSSFDVDIAAGQVIPYSGTLAN